METNTITIKVNFYINWDETIFLTEEEFEERKAHEVQDLVDDDSEMEEWVNDNFTAYDLYSHPEFYTASDIKAQWEDACEKEWEDSYNDDWTCITKTITVKIS